MGRGRTVFHNLQEAAAGYGDLYPAPSGAVIPLMYPWQAQLVLIEGNVCLKIIHIQYANQFVLKKSHSFSPFPSWFLLPVPYQNTVAIRIR